jgi:hypothetical protein
MLCTHTVELARDGATVEPLRFERGDGLHSVLFPRDETLVFDVKLRMELLGNPELGRVTMKSQVDPYSASPLLMSDGQREGYVVVISAIADGQYKVYEVHDETTTRILPQAWPAVIHRRVQTGSESRRKELLLGWQEDVFTGSYRKDRHCKGCSSRSHFLKPGWVWQDEHHCKKCRRAEHRVWRDYNTGAVPESAVDMLTAIYLARTMVADDEASLEIKLIDKLDLWDVSLTRGETKFQKVHAGTFEAVEIRMTTRPPPGDEGRDDDFEGLFGIKGSVSMWFEAETGVPVLIEGEVPVGLLDLHVRVELKYFTGTPPGFGE